MRVLADHLLWEQHHLSPVAERAGRTRGRRHAEPEHPLRTPFERDRDRIIHSGPFRKLEYKTQVFVNHEGDYYRTRLTHTLEAAQITRSVARFLRLNEDLAEAVALVHDVGHPPFGHAGEAALQEAMADHGGFEHNLQGLRVVDRLHSPYPSFPGLNLTWEVREGIAKHSKRFTQFPEELREFGPNPWPSLEAQLADTCDQIAYNAHDIDDGLTAGLITLPQLREVTLWNEVTAAHPELPAEHQKHLGVRALINAQIVDLCGAVEMRLRDWDLQSPDAVRSAPARVGDLSPAMAERNQELRDFLRQNVYHNHRVLRMSIKSSRVVSELFRSYTEFPGQLPPSAVPGPRGLCDYLAGLTDREALDEHARLFDPRRTT